jgi:nucleoid DNA-binding protein
MSVKKNSLSINKKDLVQIVSSKLKNSGIGTVPNDKLTKIFNLFTNEIVNSLKDDRSVNLRGEFSISTWMSKPILKNNPSAAGEKFVIPSQRRVRFRISDN